MSITYGEQMLARVEAQRRGRAARRRIVLLVPGTTTVLWSAADLVAARHERLVAEGAGFFAMVADHVQPLAWTVAFVLLPLIFALGRQALTAGAGLALLAGPVMTPALFGGGGWKPWQIASIGLIAVLVLGAALERTRRF